MHRPSVIHWFRQDLRLTDNPALSKAAAHGQVLPVYILDEKTPDKNEQMGSASRWWLHYALESLQQSLDGKLLLLRGNAAKILQELLDSRDFDAIYWNRCYEPWRISRDRQIKQTFRQRGVQVNTFNGSLLWEPWETLKADDTPYRVFTPFYRKGCLQAAAPRDPLPTPRPLCLMDVAFAGACSLEQLDLLPRIRWDRQLQPHWQPGESGASARLQRFVSEGLEGYKEKRNHPALPHVSRLSPHLHFGEISPQQIWARLDACEDTVDTAHFRSELAWREFSYSLLYHNPGLQHRNLQSRFDHFPWQDDPTLLRCWQRGETGYPIVDAGMRELWQTGYMHNRVRMITGSFLVKNLRLHWQHGESWFRDTLVDHDLANNSASWQWIAGCGADAAPYFRVFNPVLQGRKFDGNGDYIRRYLPQLARLPDKYLFAPWEAPAEVLAAAGIKLGKDYPLPVVDLMASREKALAAFHSLP